MHSDGARIEARGRHRREACPRREKPGEGGLVVTMFCFWLWVLGLVVSGGVGVLWWWLSISSRVLCLLLLLLVAVVAAACCCCCRVVVAGIAVVDVELALVAVVAVLQLLLLARRGTSSHASHRHLSPPLLLGVLNYSAVFRDSRWT